MIVGTVEVMGVLAIVCVLCLLLAIVDAPPRNPARYSGPVYDPQRPVIRRAGAVGWTGRICPLCNVTTYGNSDRCAKCGRMNAAIPLIRTEHSARMAVPLTPSPASEVPPRTPNVSTLPRHDTGDGVTT